MNVLYFDEQESLSKIFIENFNLYFPNKYCFTFKSNLKDFLNEINMGVPYDLIMLDIMAPLDLLKEDVINQFTPSQIELMESSDGRSIGEILFYKLRSVEKYKTVPVLFYSAKGSTEISDKNAYFLRKPQLIEELDQYISNRIFKKK
jgi:hypothetical protein